MFRALTCPSSGGTTAQTQHLVSLLSEDGHVKAPKHVEDSNVTYMLLLNCALKLVEEIFLYYDARSKKHKRRDASAFLRHDSSYGSDERN